jgi:twinkle protein
MKINWEKFSIEKSKVSGGKGFCPKCHASRKHKKDRSLSVDLETGAFNCHNCGYRGYAVEIERQKREYVKPVPRLEKLSDRPLKWFEQDRGISNNTLLRLKITEAKEWMPQYGKEVTTICFNYYRDEELVNIKFRGPEKTFKLAKDAELIFYNLNAIKGEETAVIVEGEMDCLTLHECGIYNAVSVPNGASRGSMKLEYLDNCWQDFEGKTKIVVATDNDTPGLELREELARRLGKERCYTVSYPEGCKDANDVLLKFGKEKVREVFKQLKEWPLEGIITMDEMYDTIQSWYEHGYPPGAKAGILGFDKLLSFSPKQVTTVTGIPGHGKDEFTNLLLARTALNCGWKWACADFEEEPEQTVTKLAEKIYGKSFDFRKDPFHRLSPAEYKEAMRLIDQSFFFYKTEEIDTDIDTLLSIADRLVLKYGIRGLRLNPWNWITNNTGLDGTEYVSAVYTKIIKWARKRDVHVIVIAHTTKIGKDKSGKFEVPNLYNISGSAHFYNKTHNGITVYLDTSNGFTYVYVQKVKQSWLGQKGYVVFRFNTYTRVYEFIEIQTVHHSPKDEVEHEATNQVLGHGSWRGLPPEKDDFETDYDYGDDLEDPPF